ncbi:hypothetical protein [Microbulbifer sp. SAOS-129_SWC]|uniref:hypothetical protein n=1 Tax=Microbulbifer sp. SAOS-129_SWC TaxID=3145235 RepID=UPI003216D2EC
MKTIINLLRIFLIFWASSAVALSVSCPYRHDGNIEAAPTGIFSVVRIAEEKRGFDFEVRVLNKYKDLDFKSLAVRRQENEKITFAVILETVEEEGSRKAYLLSVKPSDIFLYDFIVTYGTSDEACPNDEISYQFPLHT